MRYWEPADEADLDRIHAAACRILEELGIRIREPECRDVLTGAGARPVADEVLRLPREMIEQAIESAPETFAIFDRRGNSMSACWPRSCRVSKSTPREPGPC